MEQRRGICGALSGLVVGKQGGHLPEQVSPESQVKVSSLQEAISGNAEGCEAGFLHHGFSGAERSGRIQQSPSSALDRFQSS